jgi:hypothetical protein
MFIEVVIGGTILTDITIISNNRSTVLVAELEYYLCSRTSHTSLTLPVLHEVYSFQNNPSTLINLGVSVTFDCSNIGEFYADSPATEYLVRGHAIYSGLLPIIHHVQ